MTAVIDDIRRDDYEQWLALWDANNGGKRDDAVTAETWNRLNNPVFPVHGLVARKGNRLVGLVHYILHPVTGHIMPACYMQDVFVEPAFRKQGIARQMIGHLAATGAREGWARLYWLAEADNVAAQNLYKNLGVKLNFTFHVMPL